MGHGRVGDNLVSDVDVSLLGAHYGNQRAAPSPGRA
jgi:hypothetical protein